MELDLEDVIRLNIKHLRGVRCFSQEHLAGGLRDLGWLTIDQATVSKIEAGTRSLTFSEVLLIALALRVSPPLLVAHDPGGARRGRDTPRMGLIQMTVGRTRRHTSREKSSTAAARVRWEVAPEDLGRWLTGAQSLKATRDGAAVRYHTSDLELGPHGQFLVGTTAEQEVRKELARMINLWLAGKRADVIVKQRERVKTAIDDAYEQLLAWDRQDLAKARFEAAEESANSQHPRSNVSDSSAR